MSGQHEGLFRDAERHLEGLRNTVQSAGGPCHTCLHGTKRGSNSWDRQCRHPFVKRGSHDPVSGKVTWRYEDQRRMREGACGAEGALYERASSPVIAWRWLRWQYWIFIVLGIAAYFGALIWGISR